MFKPIPEEKIRWIYHDPVNLKLFIAESVLQHIKSKIPVEYNTDAIEFETNVETFLFFIVSVQDTLFNQINKILKVNGKSYVPKIESFITELRRRTDTKSKRISQELDECFNKPVLKYRKIDDMEVKGLLPDKANSLIFGLKKRDDGFWDLPYWDSEKSWLWELRRLRNHITHNSILDVMPYQGLSEKTALSFFVEYDNMDNLNRYEIENPLQLYQKSWFY